MKLVLLTEYFPESEDAEITGGIENRCFNLVKGLSRKHDVTVLCSRQKGQPKFSKVFDAEVVRCGFNPYSDRGNLLGRLRTAYSMYREGKRLDADVVGGVSFLTYIPAYFLGRKLDARKTATWHETWVGEWISNKGVLTGVFGEIWERIALMLNWDKVISVSNFTKKKLLRNNIRCRDICVVPNGIDLDHIKEIKSDGYEKPTACVVGRLTRHKKVDMVIRAFSEVTEQIEDAKLKTIGDGPQRRKLKKLVAELGLKENVEFSGFVNKHNDVIKMMKSSDVYVSASALEGFGITVLEAMACELPCLLSPIPPYREVTKDKAAFFENEKELAESLVAFLNSKENRVKQVEIQNKIVKDYDWSKVVKKYENIVGK